MDKRPAARIDSGMAHAAGGIVFKEDQISLLQIAGGRDLRPFTDGRKPARAITARADAAGAKRKVDKPRTVEPFGRALFGPGVRFAQHCARNGYQSIRAVGCAIGNVAAGGGIHGGGFAGTGRVRYARRAGGGRAGGGARRAGGLPAGNGGGFA